MDITTKIGYRSQLPPKLDAEGLIENFAYSIRSLQAEADRQGLRPDWVNARIEIEDGDWYSVCEGIERVLKVRVYARKA